MNPQNLVKGVLSHKKTNTHWGHVHALIPKDLFPIRCSHTHKSDVIHVLCVCVCLNKDAFVLLCAKTQLTCQKTWIKTFSNQNWIY